ncbi:MAG: hypothetical protein R3C03_21080 [Pirellulaceae bacterium]
MADSAESSFKSQIEQMLTGVPDSKNSVEYNVDWTAFRDNFRKGMSDALNEIGKKKSQLKKGLTPAGIDALEIKLRYLENYAPQNISVAQQAARGNKKDFAAKFKFNPHVDRDENLSVIVSKNNSQEESSEKSK